MIRCCNTDCIYGHCCIECDGQKSEGFQCSCDIAEDFEFDREEIINKCKFAKLDIIDELYS